MNDIKKKRIEEANKRLLGEGSEEKLTQIKSVFDKWVKDSYGCSCLANNDFYVEMNRILGRDHSQDLY